MTTEAVKVAVRVRPFNQREIDRQAKCIIEMDGQMTLIRNPDAPTNEDPKKFSFDYSYWSHDGFITLQNGITEPTPGSRYAGQQTVFDNLGQGVLKNAFEGYNCSLFAYGQTGSGKSYSMVGYGANRGIVPITCDELFKSMIANSDPSKRYEVTFSMLEIYNEQVRDLLSKENPKGGLNVRQNPTLGMFYVEGLKKVPVGSYTEIEKRMDQGTQSRTVASTQMNATSSRAHTVVTIIFDQIIKSPSGSETKKSSVMNLVDLAGSERADSTGATGDRLKEGANINKSLSALGNVISALADMSMGKKKVLVPYRDSILTKLLQNALGGNSKTIMIAALSPADINYDETLSTLRYADRAKKIQNKAVINENPMDKLIRELKEENERLKKAMESGGVMVQHDAGMSIEDIEKMRKQMEEEIRAQFMANQAMLEASDWNQQLAEAQRETEELVEGHKVDDKRRKKEIHLINLNEDPMLSGVIVYFIKEGTTTIGRQDAEPVPNICLSGLSIQKQHAILYCKQGLVEIEPVQGNGSKTKVNGVPLTSKKELTNKDRILFGSNHLYVFNNPKHPEPSDNLPAEITWEFAQKEIAQVKGFATNLGTSLSKDQQIAQEQVLEILPMVSEVNAISEELNKQKSFEVVLISAAAQENTFGSQNSTTLKVMVKMKNLLNGNTWLWERGKFMNRRYLIQDLYQKFLDGEELSKIPNEEDPFWEPAEDVMIGSANVFLQSLSYALDFDDKIMITDYKGQEEGFIVVAVIPCKRDGRPLEEDAFVDNPEDLIGKPYHFKVTVKSAEIYKPRYSKGIQVKYRVYDDKHLTETNLIKNTVTPSFNHSQVFTFDKVTKEHLEFFESGCITFLVYGTQEDEVPDAKLLKYTTRELRQMDQEVPSTSVGMARRNTLFALEVASDQSHLKTEMLLLQRKHDRLAAKERRMQDICKEWANKPEAERQFDPFFRVVSAVANSTGTRLKTRVHLLNQMLKAHRNCVNAKNDRESHFPSKLPPIDNGKSKLEDIAESDGEKILELQKKVPDNSANSKGYRRISRIDDDLISVYVFGEEESNLNMEAEQNGGIIQYEKVKDHLNKDMQLTRSKSLDEASSLSKTGRVIHSAEGKRKDGSSACVMQ